MTLSRPLLLATAVLLAVPASAQAPDTVAVRVDSVSAMSGPRPTVTVPLPNGPGVLYYRAGSVGSAFRPTPGRRAPVAAAARPVTQAAPAANVEAAREALGLPPSAQPRAATVTEGVSRLDLLLLERDLLDAIDRRLARLDLGAAPLPAAPQAPPVLVAPGQTPAPPLTETPRVSEPGPIVAAPVIGLAVPRPVPGPVTVETVERAILETGLFRTTTVNFEFAKAALLPTSAATLDVLADVLRRYPDLRVEVGGHTDDRGSDATNDALSQRRAESVRDYLVASGVASDRLTAVGYGERRPVADNGNDTGRALNRRVEFVVLNPEAAMTTRPAEAPTMRDVIREELERMRGDG